MTLSTNIEILGKVIALKMSKAAEKNLALQDKPLCLEMELYFSCMIRKQVNIRERIDSEYSVKVSDKLEVGFRPVMTSTCSVSSCEGDSPPVSDFPIEKPERYIPHWLKLDYKKGQWLGEFGYARPI